MKCSHCGAEYQGNFCPECGARAESQSSAAPTPIQQPTANRQTPVPPVSGNAAVCQKPKKPKKPIYKKWWFYVIAAVALIAIIGSISGGSKSVKINWNEMVLGSQLPEPPANKGEIHKNSSDELWVEIKNVSDKQYNDYIESCKSKGFTVDAELNSSTFDAYNAEGYKLRLSHYGSKAELSIKLEKPMEMSTITWPTGQAGSQLPAPKSTTGKFSYEHDDSFFVYVGETSKADYDRYVADCSANGFNIDYDKGDTYYRADNVDGYHISLKYEGNNIMAVEIKASKNSDTGTSGPATTEPSTEPDDSKAEESSAPSTETPSTQEISKYETIYNEYAQKIRDAAPSSSISELAEIANEGVGKMAEYMWTAKGTDGQYSTYEEWANKLLDVYMSEAR